MQHRWLCVRLLLAAVAMPFSICSSACAWADDNAELVQLIVGLLNEKDKDLRALGLEQVRSEAKGEAATKAFAGQLPKLPPEVQAGLIGALSDRGDVAARPAVREMLDSKDSAVRLAALRALGFLGDAEDVARLVATLGGDSNEEREVARFSLERLPADGAPAEIVKRIAGAPVEQQVALIEILAARRAIASSPELLGYAVADDAKVRKAAMKALGELGHKSLVPRMLKGVLKAEPGDERVAAERAVAAICLRIEEPEQRAMPVITAVETLESQERLALLPLVGRIGGPQALSLVEEAVGGPATSIHEAGVRALCNWPDASVAERLLNLAADDAHDEHKTLALKALIRIAPLPDGRSEAERLALCKAVMAKCDKETDRNALLVRTSAVRSIEALRYVLEFVDKPESTQQACLAVVELAHHRGLREPNKAEFDKALDLVIAKSKDAVVVDRAERYKKGQTWVRPK